MFAIVKISYNIQNTDTNSSKTYLIEDTGSGPLGVFLRPIRMSENSNNAFLFITTTP